MHVNPGNDDDPFVTFTWSRDVHYAKALLGSIHHFYPHRRLIVVAERDLRHADIRQLRRFPNTEVIPVMDLVRRHKFHFVGLLNKLNVLFLPDVQRAIVADADSILVEPVADRIDSSKVFTSLHGSTVDLEDPEQRSIYERWAIDLNYARTFDPAFPTRHCRFVQGCHFAVNTARFPYDVLYRSLPHLGYRHGDPAPLRAGDQGFWNLLVNWSGLAHGDCAVVPVTVNSTPLAAGCFQAHWDDVDWIATRQPKEISFIHYVGGGRRYRRRDHICPTPLEWGTALYYNVLGRRAFVTDEIHRTIGPILRQVVRVWLGNPTL